LERIRAKRLVDETGNASVLSSYNFVLSGFGSHHNESKSFEFFVAAHLVNLIERWSSADWLVGRLNEMARRLSAPSLAKR